MNYLPNELISIILFSLNDTDYVNLLISCKRTYYAISEFERKCRRDAEFCASKSQWKIFSLHTLFEQLRVAYLLGDEKLIKQKESNDRFLTQKVLNATGKNRSAKLRDNDEISIIIRYGQLDWSDIMFLTRSSVICVAFHTSIAYNQLEAVKMLEKHSILTVDFKSLQYCKVEVFIWLLEKYGERVTDYKKLIIHASDEILEYLINLYPKTIESKNFIDKVKILPGYELVSLLDQRRNPVPLMRFLKKYLNWNQKFIKFMSKSKNTNLQAWLDKNIRE